MGLPFHNKVNLDGFDQQDFQFTFALNGAITPAMVGAAVTLDTSAPNTVKMAGAGDPILGMLVNVENRNIDGLLTGMIATKFCELLPIATGLTGAAIPAIGSSVQGGGAGAIEATTYNPALPFVVELRSVTAYAFSYLSDTPATLATTACAVVMKL